VSGQRLLILLEVRILALEPHHCILEDVLGGETQEVSAVEL